MRAGNENRPGFASPPPGWRFLTRAPTETNAEMLCNRLRESGIEADAYSSAPITRAMTGMLRSIFVRGADLQAAKNALGDYASVTEAELVRAEEEDAAARGLNQRPPTKA